MAVSDTLIGSVFDGRYRIERKLGAGGTTAAPIAKAVMEAILNAESNP